MTESPRALAEEAVDAIAAHYGEHRGCRASHAKGTVCRGTFAATPEAARLTLAPHMRGEVVDVTARLSNASGDPAAPDYARDLRGLAVKFHLRDGSQTDLVAVTLPCFFARTPEDFLEFLRARAERGLRQAWRLLAFLAGHRESLRSMLAVARMKRVPSYANCRFNAVHAFRWEAADGRTRYVRYGWLPDAGQASISSREAKRRGPDYLQQELAERLEREPVRFMLQLELAAADERVDDPTAVWKPRRTVIAGVLELTGLENGGDELVFDPMRLTEGIGPSDDPVLRFRPAAYEISARRRSALPARVPR